MIEFLLPFSLGYFFSRLISFATRANLESLISSKNIILKWNTENFSWRPCPKSMVNDPSAKYMLATPVSYELLEAIKEQDDE